MRGEQRRASSSRLGIGRLTHGTAGWLVFLALALGAARVAPDYGVGWDEGVQSQYAELSLDYFLTLGRDTRCNEYLNVKFYSPVVDALAAIAYRAAPERKFEIRHLVTSVLSLLVVPALIGWGRLLASGSVGAFAVLALVTTPTFFGHAFINSKDAPLAAAFTWSSLAIARFFVRDRQTWRSYAALGAWFGVSLVVRPGVWIPLLGLYVGASIVAGRTATAGPPPIPTHRSRTSSAATALRSP